MADAIRGLGALSYDTRAFLYIFMCTRGGLYGVASNVTRVIFIYRVVTCDCY